MAARSLTATTMFLEEVARARAMAPAERLLEGPRLFDRAVRLMTDGIRHRHPGLDEAGVRAVLESQLARLRALETV